MFDYEEYLAAFQTGDDDLLVDRFFAEDVVFHAGTRDYHGKAGLRAFLAWAHDGVREVPRIQAYAWDGDRLFAEVDMDFHATKARPDFLFKAMQPGDSVTVKFFVQYRIRDGLVCELKSMTWSPERGVTRLPRLGGHPSQIAAFHAYCSAFSNADPDRYSAFYTDDVVLELGSVPPIHGRDGITGFYTRMFAQVRESVVPYSVLADDRTIAIDALSRFTAIEDAPDFVVGSLAKGEWIEVRVFVHYELRDGLISHIRVGRAGADGVPRIFRADGTRR